MLLNGDFSNGANSWNLGIYGGAATGAVVNGEYVTTPTVAGAACWYFQFTQSNLTLEQGKSYTLSFRARAASSRPVNVVIGMSAGPYSRYMDDFDITLSTTMQTFTKTFTMTAATASDARVEFNSALSAVEWVLDDVTLVAASGATSSSKFSLTLSGTTNGSIAASSAQPTAGYDSGAVVAVTATPATGYQFAGWTGACSGTGACSVTMDANKTVGASFSVIPATATNLLFNGDFSNGANYWNLGVYGGWATGAVVNGEYVTTPTAAGSESWHFQFTQGNLTLEQGKTYTLSFQARAASDRTIEANVGMNASPYTSYMGGFDVSLTTTMQTFTKTFTMTDAATTTTARIEFNSGLSAVQWTLDNVTLVAGTVTPGTVAPRANALLSQEVAGHRMTVSGHDIAFDATGMGTTTLELRSIDGANTLTLWTGSANGPIVMAADRVPRGIWIATLRGQSSSQRQILNLVR
jgi:uncharacterized repeat protein (TIGR02543 family)